MNLIQSQSSFDGTEQITGTIGDNFLIFKFSPQLEYLSGAKRIKRTSSPISTNLYINSSNTNSDSDDERDSSLNSTTGLSNTILTCPICNSTYHRLGHLVRHAKRKHHTDLSNYTQSHSFDILTTADMEKNNSNEQLDRINSTDQPSKVFKKYFILNRNLFFFS